MASGVTGTNQKTSSSGTRIRKCNKIFISWSGARSKEIAIALKNCLETDVFCNTNLRCFVSDQDIASGADWWDKIQKELKSCKLGIVCITKENLRAPWIYFEAGAIVARDVPVIPFLINCNRKQLSETPLGGKESREFHNPKDFIHMLRDISHTMGYTKELADTQVEALGEQAYKKLRETLKEHLQALKDTRVFNEKYVYPSKVKAVKVNTIYISAPMSSIDEEEYGKLCDCVKKLEPILHDIGFSDVYSPLLKIKPGVRFEGRMSAVKKNFPILKGVDSILFIYPKNVPSSVLVEMGYGIALSKRMAVFYCDELPYIIQGADGTLNNVKTFKISDYDEICMKICDEKLDMFEGIVDD